MRNQILNRPLVNREMTTPTPPEDSNWPRHRGPVTCAAPIPGTDKVITSGYDGAVGLFDLSTGAVRLLGYHDHLVNRVTVNAAGTCAATSSSDYNIILWDLKTLKPIRVLRAHSDDVEDFAFVNDRIGASVSRDWRVLVWDLEHGSVLRVLDGHQKDALSVNYHDGRLFTSGDDMTLRVWDVETGKQLRSWGPFETETDTCAIDAIRGRAVLGCDDGCVRVFDIATGASIGKIEAHSSGIKKVAVSPRTGDILSAAYDQKIHVWDGSTLEKRVTLERQPALWERSFNWTPDGATIVAGTFDGTVLAWDATSGTCTKEIGDQGPVVGNACFNEASVADDGQIVLVSDDGLVRLGQLTEREARWGPTIKPVARVLMNAVTLDERSEMVVCGAHDHTVTLFDRVHGGLTNERMVRLAAGPINSVRVAHHPGFEGVTFVATYSGAIVRVARDGKVLGKFRVHENAVKALRLHPSKPMGVSCSADGVLVSWDLEGNLLQQFLGHTAIIDDVDIAPSGRQIASTGRDFTLKVFETESGRLLHSVSLGRRSPKGICFHDESTVIVSNYWGELLKVSLADGHVVRRQIARNGISSVNRSGAHVVATSYDGAVYLVGVEDLNIVQVLRAMTQRAEPASYA